jgi:serine/threonine protein kinase
MVRCCGPTSRALLTGPAGCSGLHRLLNSRNVAKFIRHDLLRDFALTEGRVYSLLRSAPHPHLPKILTCVDSAQGLQFPESFCQSEPGSAIVFPPYEADLHCVVRHHEKLPEHIAKVFFAQLMSAVAHCHRLNIVLGDIRLGKIMFDSADLSSVVFADLSGARHITTSGPIDYRSMSPAYVPPEVFSLTFLEPQACKPVDIWAMGIVLFYMLAGCFPFASLEPAELVQQILAAKCPFPSHVSPAARRLLSRMLSRDPADRPTAAEILCDPFVTAQAPLSSTTSAAAATPCRVPEPVDLDGDSDQLVPSI